MFFKSDSYSFSKFLQPITHPNSQDRIYTLPDIKVNLPMPEVKPIKEKEIDMYDHWLKKKVKIKGSSWFKELVGQFGIVERYATSLDFDVRDFIRDYNLLSVKIPLTVFLINVPNYNKPVFCDIDNLELLDEKN